MKELDINTWGRRELYKHFSSVDYPFYAVTIPVEVTKVKKISKEKNVSFYHLMIWLCTKALNSIEAFRMRIRDDKIYVLDRTNPSCTAMKKGSENFIIIAPTWYEDYREFSINAQKQIDTQEHLFGDTKDNDSMIYYSSTPWFNFTALSSERNFDKNDTIPRVAWGKYYEDGEKLKVNISLDVNHRTIDGYHIGCFIKALEGEIEELS